MNYGGVSTASRGVQNAVRAVGNSTIMASSLHLAVTEVDVKRWLEHLYNVTSDFIFLFACRTELTQVPFRSRGAPQHHDGGSLFLFRLSRIALHDSVYDFLSSTRGPLSRCFEHARIQPGWRQTRWVNAVPICAGCLPTTITDRFLRVWLSVACIRCLHTRGQSVRHVSVLWRSPDGRVSRRGRKAVDGLGLVLVYRTLVESASCGEQVDGMMGGKLDLQGNG